MPEIKMAVEVERQFLLDIMTTMVEAPFTIWSWDGIAIDDIDRDKDLNVTSFRVTADDPKTGESTGYLMDEAAVVHGIQHLLDGIVPLDPSIIGFIARGVRESDAGDVDAIAADAIMQSAFFLEVVYG